MSLNQDDLFLSWLIKSGGQSNLSVGQIAKQMNLKKISLYQAIKRLQKKNLISITYELKDPTQNKITTNIKLK